MGREFLDIFEGWAEQYDSSVSGQDEEYKEVFEQYEAILQDTAKLAFGNVLEFGTGTGNLTMKLLNNNLNIYGIEPSKPMRDLAIEKLGNRIPIKDGDFLQFPKPDVQIDSIVSTYAFHHLTDIEKEEAVEKYSKFLQSGSKILFADTMFENEKSYIDTIKHAKQRGFHNLAEDLQREYYTTIPVLRNMFEKHGFDVTFTRYNHFVWLLNATKK
ncbi:methyltransferase domain-containing protein [Shimazuella sp. AN120528]|uniref:class I SAM-dependent methyltransferase n=1 Tax=Shimazuella soli TaxID=1892854 RepID=UPI001F115EED|nr:class I SAM-dependent methyltransferase [Shimazuella soli]MCH5586081.1 methyltransferase domain-containing protein [Shimazuella soli]